MRSNGFKTQGTQGPQRCLGKLWFFLDTPVSDAPVFATPETKLLALTPQLTSQLTSQNTSLRIS